MNAPEDFEQHLRSLHPAAASPDEASVMYACGYEAGRRAVLETQHRSGRSWSIVAAAVLLSGLLSGWGGYGLARHNASALVAEQGRADAPRPELPRPVVPTAERSATHSAPPAAERPATLTPTPAAVAPAAERPATPTAVADDGEPGGATHALERPFAFFQWWSETPSASHQIADNCVVLTAASGSDEWIRWMEERPLLRSVERPQSDADSAARVGEEQETRYLTPMHWRSGDSRFDQWLQ